MVDDGEPAGPPYFGGQCAGGELLPVDVHVVSERCDEFLSEHVEVHRRVRHGRQLLAFGHRTTFAHRFCRSP
jgi:hypothetical protein